jgi:hypothetical protein
MRCLPLSHIAGQVNEMMCKYNLISLETLIGEAHVGFAGPGALN